MKLYTFPPAPNPAKVGFYIREKGIELETVVRSGRLPGASIVRGVLFLPRDMTELPGKPDRVPRSVLLDISGRKMLELRVGRNDVSRLAPGV